MMNCQHFVAEDEVNKYVNDRIHYSNALPKPIVEFLSRNIRGENKENPYFDLMLDAGCGFGIPTRFFSPYFRSITGFDISERMIEKANELNDADNIRYIVGLGEDMPTKDESVDLVTCTWAIHFMDVDKFVTECRRVLKPNGCAAIIGPIVSDLLCRTETAWNDGEGTTAIDLWNSYLDSVYAYSKRINHPQQYAADMHQPIYDKITGMNKTRKTDMKFSCHLTLKEFMSAHLAIPCYQMREAEPGLENESMKMFAEKVKKLWNISHLNDQDIKLEVIYSAIIIFLTKKE